MTRDPSLPPWADELRSRYLSGEASMFVVHGNVRDVFPWEGTDGATTYLSLREFLERFLGRSKDIVVSYNVSEGLRFPDKNVEKRFRTAMLARRTMLGEPPLDDLPTRAEDVLPVLEELVMDPSQRAAVVIDYAEMIVPTGEFSFMGEADKSNLVTLQRWTSDPALLKSDNLVILVAENLADIHRRLISRAQLVPVTVQLPGEPERLSFLRSFDRRGLTMEMSEEALARVTAGLSLTQIRGIFRQARQSREPITFRAVARKKKAIIEQECHGLVEFVDPGHGFDHVGGMDRLKADLMRVAAAIKAGATNRVPMGIIFVGPMGTGKTYLAEAFAGESGLTCLKFKNFREKWVGSTESNLEKILQVVDGLGYVLLIIDEADRSMGSASDGDGGTSSRVIARLKEFMSDTTHRGRVVILMMTNRPDKLDTDLKRPGRFDLKIPFFFPETVAERASILGALARKNRLQTRPELRYEAAAEATAGYSSAELEAVMMAAANQAAEHDRTAIGEEDLSNAVRDVIPSRDTRMLEFMEMLAVFESSSRRMLPERYQGLDTEQVHARLDELRLSLRGRA
jgi:transitional endoplasmic reticulum ATPase